MAESCESPSQRLGKILLSTKSNPKPKFEFLAKCSLSFQEFCNLYNVNKAVPQGGSRFATKNNRSSSFSEKVSRRDSAHASSKDFSQRFNQSIAKAKATAQNQLTGKISVREFKKLMNSSIKLSRISTTRKLEMENDYSNKTKQVYFSNAPRVPRFSQNSKKASMFLTSSKVMDNQSTITVKDDLCQLDCEIRYINNLALTSQQDPLNNNYFSKLKRQHLYRENIRSLLDSIQTRVRQKKLFPLKSVYNIQELIGSGLYGEVFRATQVLTNLPVAIKVFDRTQLPEETFKKIKAEIEILKALSHHKGICALLEVITDDNHVYCVMEYQPGGDLVKFFKSNYLFDEWDLKTFFYQLLMGVQYIHSKGIIHRDIKLDNILLDKNVNPVVCDFGISVFASEVGKVPKDTGGTPDYLAPEILDPLNNISYKTDVWTLGVLLFIMAFGEPPFKSPNSCNQELYQKIITGKFVFPEKSEASEALRNLIRKMVVVDVQKRYSLTQVLKDPWLFDVKLKALELEKSEVNEWKKREAAFNYLRRVGFSSEEICIGVKERLLDHVSACYWNLIKNLDD